MSDDGPKLILLEEFLEQRLRKEQEISYYEEQMKEIERKLFFLRKERELTATIIDMRVGLSIWLKVLQDIGFFQ